MHTHICMCTQSSVAITAPRHRCRGGAPPPHPPSRHTRASALSACLRARVRVAQREAPDGAGPEANLQFTMPDTITKMGDGLRAPSGTPPTRSRGRCRTQAWVVPHSGVGGGARRRGWCRTQSWALLWLASFHGLLFGACVSSRIHLGVCCFCADTAAACPRFN
jgi:hypothetical protein